MARRADNDVIVKLSNRALWMKSLRATGEFKPGWYLPGLFSDSSLLYAMMLMFLHSSVTGLCMYLHSKGLISLRVKNLYSISMFLTVQGGGLYVLGLLNLRRAAAILIAMVVAVSWEYYFTFNYKMLSPMLLLSSGAIIYWAIADPRLAYALGIRRDKIVKDLFYSILIALVCGGYVLVLLSNFGYKFDIDPWKVIKHSSIVSGQDLIAFSIVYAVWRRLHDNGLSHAGNMGALLIIFFSLLMPAVIGYSLGGDFGFFMSAFAAVVNSLMLMLVAHFSFKNFGNVLPVVFVMTASQEAMLMAGLL